MFLFLLWAQPRRASLFSLFLSSRTSTVTPQCTRRPSFVCGGLAEVNSRNPNLTVFFVGVLGCIVVYLLLYYHYHSLGLLHHHLHTHRLPISSHIFLILPNPSPNTPVVDPTVTFHLPLPASRPIALSINPNVVIAPQVELVESCFMFWIRIKFMA